MKSINFTCALKHRSNIRLSAGLLGIALLIGCAPQNKIENTIIDSNQDTEIDTDKVVNCVLNPYKEVNWSTWRQYKANFHTHTTNSGGDQSPATVIEEYHCAGYAVLAITDHNHVTWPWTDYGKDPATLNMIAVKGDEYSDSNHMNAFYNFKNSDSNLEDGIPHVQSNNGFAQINHPGRYKEPSDWEWYIPWFRDYSSCVGLEVYNQGDRYPSDRKLWDNINEHYFKADGKLVWGTSNDDKHSTSNLYHNYQFMLMPKLSENELRTSRQNGAFYFCYEPDGTGKADVPRITRIEVSNTEKTIVITATGYNAINWVGPQTKTMATGATFDFLSYQNKPFIRAVLDGSNGDCFTQPFGFETSVLH